MKKMLISVALAATALALPTVASAQQRGDILIVDADRIGAECTACKAAATQLQAKQGALRTRAQQIQTQLTTEGTPLRTAVEALNGKQPDAALQARIDAFEKKRLGLQQELVTSQNNLESTQANVQQQILTKLLVVVEQVRARHAAKIVLSKNSTMANDNSIDVTTEVLTALNQQLPAVSVTPLPRQQAPQGR